MPTTEIAVIPLAAGSDIGDPSNPAAAAAKEGFDTLHQQDGMQAIRFGMQVENPSVLQLFIDWDKIDSHQTFMASETYQPFMKKWGEIADGDAFLYHVDFKPEGAVPKVLSAPVTEVVTMWYGNGIPDDAPDRLGEFVEKLAKGDGCFGAAYGVTHEEVVGKKGKAKAIILAVGWQSVEAHTAYRDTPDFKAFGKFFREGQTEVEMHHVAVLHALAS